MSNNSMILDLAHISMQFNDSPSQMEADANRLFSQSYDWFTGTEASGRNPLDGLLRKYANLHGYTYHSYKSNWIAINRRLILPGTYKTGGLTVMSNDRLQNTNGSDPNVVWVTFENEKIGTVSVLGSHYPRFGRPSGNAKYQVNLEENEELARAIGGLAREKGRGLPLVWYGGDQNIVDKVDDTFFGQPLTSAWDELGVYENTGHGNIDVIASFDWDTRVKAEYIRAVTDEEIPLFTDHYLVEAGYRVDTLN